MVFVLTIWIELCTLNNTTESEQAHIPPIRATAFENKDVNQRFSFKYKELGPNY